MGDWRYGRLEPAKTFSTDCVIKDQSDVSFMHIHCVSHSVHTVLSHLQHNHSIMECMRGVYVLAKHSSSRFSVTFSGRLTPITFSCRDFNKACV